MIAVPLVVGAAILVPIAASASVDLPDMTPRELIDFAAASDVSALSGTIEQTSELGLPDLGALTGADDVSGDPGSSDSASHAADIDDLIALVTGSHTAKVYLDGAQARLQVLDQLAERNVYVDGEAGDVWYVDSESASATRLVLPTDAEVEQLMSELPSSSPAEKVLPTPDAMLDRALSHLDETTEVSVGTDARVAGREAYELILTPRTADTLVGDVRFAIDGENGVALAASVTARGASDPAFSTGFTQVDFAVPDAAVFAFAPGDGITVTEKDVPLPTAQQLMAGRDGAPQMPDAQAPVVSGQGWATVVQVSGQQSGDAALLDALDPEQLALLDSATTAVEGGRALQTSLVSVLITDDGRVLAGAVPMSRLVDAAQSGR